MKWTSVDPGLDGLGVACWKGSKLVRATTLYFKGDDAAYALARKAKKFIRKHSGLEQVICEFPIFYPSAVGYASASTGALLKLTYSVGVLHGVLRPREFVNVPVRDYRGQLPKGVVRRRVLQTLGSKNIDSIASHAYDAVYLGLWWVSEDGMKWRLKQK